MKRVWRASVDEIPGGTRYEIHQDGGKLRLRELFSLLETSSEFAIWYTNLLSASVLDAFFWEHPPFRSESFDQPAEFVLQHAPALASRRPDVRAFEAELRRFPDSDVGVFPNLGGDALLVVPKAAGPPEAYVHLASFLRSCSLFQPFASARCNINRC